MKQQSYLFILTFGVFSIINMEMGVIGILPMIASFFQVSISKAGLLISLFALVVAISGPIMPLLFSGINRRKMMLFVLAIFFICNLVAAFTSSFVVALIARIIPAFFQPVYCSLAFATAAASVDPKDAPKAVSKVLMGVSAGMVLGVPIISFIASISSLQMAMLSFAVISGIALGATWFFVPSLPVAEKLSYGSQLSILKKPMVWISFATVVFLNGSMFGVFGYLAEYLKVVTQSPEKFISGILLIYGVANMIGNGIGGKLLTQNANRTALLFPIFLGAIYLLLFTVGNYLLPVALIVLLWGILAGIGTDINQYWITSAAPEAPDFANGLFLSATNLGTTLCTALCGFIIAGIGIEYLMIGGALFLVMTFISVSLRVFSRQA